MDKLKLAQKISKRANCPFYIARYKVGFEILGTETEWMLFFKEKDLPKSSYRFWRRWNLGFKFNERFSIYETTIPKPQIDEKIYKVCHYNEHGKIYKYN